MGRYLLNLEREMILATAEDMGGEPVVKHGRCSNLYSYEGFDKWLPTPVMAATAYLNWLEADHKI